MNLKGIVTSIENNCARVTFPDRNNTVSSLIKKASHVPDLSVNDNVIAIFFSDSMNDGVIIAKF